MNTEKRIFILKRLQKNYSKSRMGLNFSSPFELLIAVLLSTKTKDTSVNKATSMLFAKANTPIAILEFGIERIKCCIRTLGLFNTKAENIVRICKILVDKYNGMVPEDRLALESLPGIGRKSTDVVLNTAFGWPTIAVDTHVFRVCNRTNFASGKSVRKVEKKLIKVVPLEFKYNCHNWLVMHGRYTCIARNPRCRPCIIQDLCESKEKHLSK